MAQRKSRAESFSPSEKPAIPRMEDKIQQMGGILQSRTLPENEAAEDSQAQEETPYGYYVEVSAEDEDGTDSEQNEQPQPQGTADNHLKKVLTSMSLDEDLPFRIRDYARSMGLSNQGVIERVLGEVSLEEISQKVTPQEHQDGTFPSNRRGRRDVKTRTMSIYFTPEQLDWIAEGVKKTGATSRSHFVSAAVDLFFDVRRPIR